MIPTLQDFHDELVREGKYEAADLIAQAIVALGGAQASASSGGTGNGPPPGN